MPRPPDLKARQREHDAKRRAEKPWRAWYRTARWKQVRQHQLRIEPHCRMCKARGQITSAIVCDHVERHRGDPIKFWAGPFQSLCTPCHDTDKQRVEHGGTPRQDPGPDGWPEG